MTNTKYVVCDEHTLGYQDAPDGIIGILHSSILKGASFELYPEPKLPSQFKTIRPATSNDFINFSVKAQSDFELTDDVK